MENLLNHWYVKDNVLFISLMRFNAYISIQDGGIDYYFLLNIVDDNDEKLELSFYSLADAISFVQNVLHKCSNIQKAALIYRSMYALADVNVTSDKTMSLTLKNRG